MNELISEARGVVGFSKLHEKAFIGDGVAIGRDVEIAAGAIVLGPTQIGEGCRISAGCLIDPGMGGDKARVILEDDVEVGAGAIIAAPVRVSKGARIQPGSVVTREVPPHAIISGNPAQIIGYTLSERVDDTSRFALDPGQSGVVRTGVTGVTVHRLPKILDLRGNLTVGEFSRSVPFAPKRYFMVFGVPNAEVRGEHAHRSCEQFLVCASGQCSVVADDGDRRQEFVLDDPSLGLHLPALTWGVQYKYSRDAVLLVFASEYYDVDEYIRDYDEFRQLAAGRPVPEA